MQRRAREHLTVQPARSDWGCFVRIDTFATLPRWLTEDDVAYFARQLAGSGFRGGLNRYRNMDRDCDEACRT